MVVGGLASIPGGRGYRGASVNRLALGWRDQQRISPEVRVWALQQARCAAPASGALPKLKASEADWR
jgi:hypothetical protein